MERSRIFGKIYETGAWGVGSGPGSDASAAKPYVDFVLGVVASQGISSVVDVGHGDWRMWPDDAFAGTAYYGLDVAAGLSKQVDGVHGAPGRSFTHRDAVVDDLPVADLVISKDVLQHLSNSETLRVLERISRFPMAILCHDIATLPSGRKGLRRRLAIRARSKYVLSGRGIRVSESHLRRPNRDIETGGHRELDIEAEPFGLVRYNWRLQQRFDFTTPLTASRMSRKRVWLLEKES